MGPDCPPFAPLAWGHPSGRAAACPTQAVGFWSAPPPAVYGSAVMYVPTMPQIDPHAVTMAGWTPACPRSAGRASSAMARVEAEGMAPFRTMTRGGSGRSQDRRQAQPLQLPLGVVAAALRELGIEPQEEERFGWIAEYGLVPDAQPPGWTLQVDAQSQRVYFVNTETQESYWQNPLKPYLSRVVEAGRRYLERPTVGFFDGVKQLAWERNREELRSWHGPFTDEDSGQAYFVNSSTGDSTWQDPRELAQYFFELERGLLTGLKQILPTPADVEAAMRRSASSGQGGSASAEPMKFSNRDASTFVSEASVAPRRRSASSVRDSAAGADWMKSSNSDMSTSASETMKFSSSDASTSASEMSVAPRRKSCFDSLKASAMGDSAQERARSLRAAGRARMWLEDVWQAEEVSQRRQITKKVDLRRLRKLQPLAMGSGGAVAPSARSGAPLDAQVALLGEAGGCTDIGVPPDVRAAPPSALKDRERRGHSV